MYTWFDVLRITWPSLIRVSLARSSGPRPPYPIIVKDSFFDRFTFFTYNGTDLVIDAWSPLGVVLYCHHLHSLHHHLHFNAIACVHGYGVGAFQRGKGRCRGRIWRLDQLVHCWQGCVALHCHWREKQMGMKELDKCAEHDNTCNIYI